MLALRQSFLSLTDIEYWRNVAGFTVAELESLVPNA